MEKPRIFDVKCKKTIDAVEYNGKYTDVSRIRTRVFAAGAVLFTAILFLGFQLVWYFFA